MVEAQHWLLLGHLARETGAAGEGRARLMANIESFFDVERCDDRRIMKLCHDGFKMASA